MTLPQSFTTGTSSVGYALSNVEVGLETLASTGPLGSPTVTLHSGSATGATVADFSGPSAITPAAIERYKYWPTTEVTLNPSTEYWVVAQGGAALVSWTSTDSDDEDDNSEAGWSISNTSGSRVATSTGAYSTVFGAYLFRVNGVVANSPATGTPTIAAPNVFRVPATLGVTFAGVLDHNGTTMIEDTALYNWQRFAADGTTLEAASIGTGSTYTLTDADAGKTLKCLSRSGSSTTSVTRRAR